MVRLVLALAVMPLVASAQSAAWGGVFVAYNAALPDPPFAIGFEVRASFAPAALRLSAGGLRVGAPSEHQPDTSSYHGAIDVDLLLDAAPPDMASLMPFVGVGAVAAAPRRARSEAVMMWSYGIGVRIPIDRQLVLQLETRERIPMRDASATTALGIGRGWEQRIGLSIPFRGGPRR